MEDLLFKAIHAVRQSKVAFSKFITANDTGSTGANQYGYHIHKNAWPLFFYEEGQKGSNADKFVKIRWQDSFETESRFIYYGKKTRNEYRLTRFGRNFPFLQDQNIGDLLILCKRDENFYEGYVLQSDESIDGFLTEFNISPNETNAIITISNNLRPKDSLYDCFTTYINQLRVEFPPTYELATQARACYRNTNNIKDSDIIDRPDHELLQWLSSEYELFKLVESSRYSERIKKPFNSVEELVETANTILNRRKSRAGKSLEHHLAEVFRTFKLKFDSQSVTEDNKKPDFIFPGIETYMQPRINSENIFVLAAKTTCKDRWRQILNEADRVRVKHLFTLQQGISKAQLSEMYKYDVCLVVPQAYISSFPKDFRDRILSLGSFIGQVKRSQIN